MLMRKDFRSGSIAAESGAMLEAEQWPIEFWGKGLLGKSLKKTELFQLETCGTFMILGGFLKAEASHL
jgi:hypothetical protein